MGGIHDIESYFSVDNAGSLNAQIFSSHFGHLAVISSLAAAEMFHIGWNGNFSAFLKNPIATLGIAHGIGDPHFGSSISQAYSSGGSYYRSLGCFSGIYNWLYAAHFTSVFEIYNLVIACELLAVALLTLGNIHYLYSSILTWYLGLNKGKLRGAGVNFTNPTTSKLSGKVYPIFLWPYRLFVASFDSAPRFTVDALAGISAGWAAHLALSSSGFAGFNPNISDLLYPFYTGDWSFYSGQLTFLGALRSDTSSLYLTDIAHHHLAIAGLVWWATKKSS
jgi:photosystem I P700 chlorophyll a apoprotein A2